MANTSIQLKKSGVTGNTPSGLAFGEVAINYADGKLYYKNSLGGTSYISNQFSFDTINANNSLILATGVSDTLSFVAGNNITISTNTTTKTITINSSGGATDQFARDAANSAGLYANAAFAAANSGGSSTDQTARNTANASFIQANAAFELSNTLSVSSNNLGYFNRSYTGDNTTTSFTVTSGVTNNSIIVTENGILQSPNADYYVNGTNLIFRTAPSSSVNIGIRELASTGNVAVSSERVEAAFTQANAAFDTANTDVTNINITSATYGNTTTVPVITVAANGRIISISNTTITGGGGAGTDNVARDTANSAALYANGAFAQANAAYESQNTTGTYANSAYSQANTATNNAAGASLYANGAFIQANAAYDSQNTTGSYANSAFSKANNALPTSGGTISGSLTVTQDVSITGNLVVLGNTTSINTNSFTVEDTLLTLGLGNYTSDLLDIGFSSHYNDGTNAHTGLIRDASEKSWMFFEGYTPEVSPNNNIVITDPSFRYANLRARDITGNLIANTVTINGFDVFNYITNAYTQANTATNNAAGASLYANGAFAQANAAFTRANSVTSGFRANTVIIANSTGFLSNSNVEFSLANNTLYVQNASATNTVFANSITFNDGTKLISANGIVASTAANAVTANVAVNARITNVTTGTYYPIVTDTTITGSDTFHYSSNDFLMYAANNTFRASGNLWAGQFLTVGTNIPVVNATGHWVGQTINGVDQNARTTANAAFIKANTVSNIFNGTSNVFINSANGDIVANVSGSTIATVTNTGIILSSTNITGANNIYASAFIANTRLSVAGSGGDITGANNIFASVMNVTTASIVAGINVVPYIQSAFIQANAAYAQANTGGGGGGPGTDNVARETANAAFIQANAAFEAANAANLSIYSNFYTANGNTATFNLTTSPQSKEYTIVNIDGVIQLKNTYSLSGNTVILSENVTTNSSVEITVLGGSGGGGGGGGGGTSSVYSRTSITATAGQTSFAVAYNVGFLSVYFNGALLNSTDYTATDGSTVVLADAAAVGDIVEFVTFNTVSVTAVPNAILNSTNITANLTITAGYSAVSVGPLSIANGVNITIADGQKWVIL